MLRHRVIPIVLLDGYSVVKTIKFDVRRNLGNPITVARIYNTRNVDELILLDIDATKEGRRIDMATIHDVASECFMPLCVGGGLRTIDDIAEALASGADKVSINAEGLKNPEFLAEASRMFGNQCIVASVDVVRDTAGIRLYAHASHALPEMSVVDWCRRAEAQGCGEILLNSVDRDGTMTGYDLELIASVTREVNIPVIAAGGAAEPADSVRALREGGAAAVAAASIYHFTNHTPLSVKSEIAAAGLPVRI